MELPDFVQIEPVGQCNLRCRMCPIQFRRDGPPHGPLAFMEFEVFCALIDQFPGIKELQLQGLGEPMMHPRFFEMVSYAADKGIKVSTNSNLSLLSRRRAEQCATSGLDLVHVSLDSASPAIYEQIRVRGRLAKVLRNLERLIEARARLGRTRPGIRLVAVAMRANLDGIPDLVRLAAEFGIDSLFVQHLCHDFGESTLPAHYRPMREFVDRQSLLGEDPTRVERCFGEARTIAGQLDVELRLPRTQARVHPPGTPGRKRCDWPWRGAYLSYSGEAMPCCMVATPDRISFGNMARSGVEPIWNNAEYETFRRRLDSDEPPEVCRSCALYSGTF